MISSIPPATSRYTADLPGHRRRARAARSRARARELALPPASLLSTREKGAFAPPWIESSEGQATSGGVRGSTGQAG